jgi:hypothetical protein
MSQSGGMAAFAWPNAAQGIASSGITTSPSAATPTAKSTDVSNPAKHPEPTSTASDRGAFFSSDASTITSTAVDSGVFYSSDVAASTSTALDSGMFYSSDVPASTSTASDGGALFSLDVPTTKTGCHHCTACTQTISITGDSSRVSHIPTAASENPWNPYVIQPMDASPSYVDYGTLSTPRPKATGVPFDRGTPFEMSDPIIPVVNPSQDIHFIFTKRENARFGRNPGPVIGGVLTFFTVVLVIFLSIKYCARSCSRSKKKTTDLEKGNSSRRYSYYEESVRGRKRRRDGSPPVTRPDDIPISESYGMDPVELARSQNWQEGFDERGVYSTRDCVNRYTGTDNFQSTATYGNGDAGEYGVQLPSFIPTHRVNPKSVPVTKLPGLARNPEYTAGQPVSPLDTADEQHDYDRMRDYSDVSPLHSPAMHHEGCK